jgi:acyl-CoA synthetase (AMP-forming)/AMP-acid ligase II
MPPTTLAQILVNSYGNAPAVIAELPAVTLTYQQLSDQIEQLAARMRGTGLQPGDVVALVLPNGPAFVVVMLALVRARLVAAPLDPAYPTFELRTFLDDFQPRAVIADDPSSAATHGAVATEVPVWNAAMDISGVVSISQLGESAPGVPDTPAAEDPALLLHTSGTTGLPKGVSLSHANVLLSALHTAQHYALTAADRSLVVLPMHHGHGLIGATLSTLVSGGAVVVPPRFSASRFWTQFRTHEVTWFTAVPTIHEILLSRADRDGAPERGARFIRSCSAELAPTVQQKVEQRFGAPVLEAYGMTETAHQVASNPLPPLQRKPGTVGFATGVEIAVVNDAGVQCAPNHAGEVVVRGPTVAGGYRNNPEATAAAFIGGWFRTGDIGVLDDDGYLALTGRIKDMINRGGEKISPTEIDDVLLSDPDVADAASFGVPDTKYGEEVWAAVVVRGQADAAAVQDFSRSRLAAFKVPKVIRVVPTIPKNSMGKVDRQALAQKFAPRTQKTLNGEGEV